MSSSVSSATPARQGSLASAGGSAVRISKPQLRRLHTLWGLLCATQKLGPPGDLRDGRLAWIGGQVGRQIATTKELTRQEAEKAIDALQACLPEDLIIKRRRADRRQARAYGTAGRRGKDRRRSRGAGSSPLPTVDMVDPPTLELLATLKAKLCWDNARFEAWLRSRSSPTGGRTEILTLGQANAVIWALKNMLRKSHA